MSAHSPSSFFLPLLVNLDQLPSEDAQAIQLLEPYLPAATTTTRLSWHRITGDESLSIDHVRTLQQELAYASPTGLTRIFVIANFNRASLPAQQALLKLLEEPPADTLVVLCARQVSQVLPTIQSRCHLCFVTTAPQLPEARDESPTPPAAVSLTTLSLGQCLEQAEQYTDHDAAVAAVEYWLNELHQVPSTAASVRQQQLLLQAYNQLQSNAQPRLIMEDCLLRIAGY